MQFVFLVVWHLQHDRKVQLCFDNLLFIPDSLYVVWSEPDHALDGYINSENVVQVVVVFDCNHDEPLL